jgi:thiamine pyrophosphate-dependent acetolactate synthase large subunit-like protein
MVAQGLGGYAERVEKVADLKPALKRAVEQTEAGRATLLEIITAEETALPGS